RRLRRAVHRGAALPGARLLVARTAPRQLADDPHDRDRLRPLSRPRRGPARAGAVRLRARVAALANRERPSRHARPRDVQRGRSAERLPLVLGLVALDLGLREVLGGDTVEEALEL